MNNCDVNELKQIAVNRFLSIPTESFVELKSDVREKTKFGGDYWEWGFALYNYALYLNGVEVASWDLKDDKPRWYLKTQEIEKHLLKEKQCAKLMEALGMAQKQQALAEEQKWPKRKWWQFRK